jgi:hypothetical protein
MVETILSSPFVTEIVLPFLLVFTLIFAILEKTRILGEGKRQINAIIGLVIGLFLVAFPFARSIVVGLMPLLAVIAVVILVFTMLFAFASGGKEEFVMPKGLKVAFGVLIGLALIVALLVLTGYWDVVFRTITEGRELATNIFFILIIVAAIIIVIATSKETASKPE